MPRRSLPSVVVIPMLLFGKAVAVGQNEPPVRVRLSGPVYVAAFNMSKLLDHKVDPALPAAARPKDASESVLLRASIGEDGRVKELEVVAGSEVLRRPALEAVRQWTYRPNLWNGQAIAVKTVIPVVFPDGAGAQTSPPVRMSGGVMMGNAINHRSPTFPEVACHAHVSGSAVMEAFIGKDGLVRDVEYVSGPQLLREAYTEAVRQWTYRPFLIDGVPVEVETFVTMSVGLNGSC